MGASDELCFFLYGLGRFGLNIPGISLGVFWASWLDGGLVGRHFDVDAYGFMRFCLCFSLVHSWHYHPVRHLASHRIAYPCRLIAIPCRTSYHRIDTSL